MYRRLLLPLGYMAALLLLSSIPGDLEQDNIVGKAFMWVAPAWQNLIHVPLYAGLALSWIWALHGHLTDLTWRLVAAFILTCIWAVVDETYQLSVPGRYGSLTDVALNVLGAITAVLYTHVQRSTPTGP